jgi:hypothetical protein
MSSKSRHNRIGHGKRLPLIGGAHGASIVERRFVIEQRQLEEQRKAIEKSRKM